MTDPILLPLAQACFECYADGAKFAWEDHDKVAHVLETDVDGFVVFAFAGTMDLEEWAIDLAAWGEVCTDHPTLGRLHAGFHRDADAAVDQFILPRLAALGYPPYLLTGHSKGAAEAEIALALLIAAGHPPVATRLFEPPRAGGAELAAALRGCDLGWTQTYNSAGIDQITQIPAGPRWCDPPAASTLLRVPDAADWLTKHRLPAVITAIKGVTMEAAA